MKRIFAMMLAAMLMLGMAACGGSAADTVDTVPGVDLTAVYESMSETLPDMMVMDPVSMMDYYGVDAEKCSQYVMAICGDGMRADEVWLMEAKDEAALAELKEMADSRLTAKEDETIDYTPDQYEIVKEAELYTNGLYLVFLVSPEVDTLKSVVDAAIG